jgi:hypothetical protein
MEKTRRFPDEGESVQAAWADCLLDYCDRARESDWQGILITDEIGKAFAAGLKAGREQK